MSWRRHPVVALVVSAVVTAALAGSVSEAMSRPPEVCGSSTDGTPSRDPEDGVGTKPPLPLSEPRRGQRPRSKCRPRGSVRAPALSGRLGLQLPDRLHAPLPPPVRHDHRAKTELQRRPVRMPGGVGDRLPAASPPQPLGRTRPRHRHRRRYRRNLCRQPLANRRKRSPAPSRASRRRAANGPGAILREMSLTSMLFRAARLSATARAASRGPKALGKRAVRIGVGRAWGRSGIPRWPR